MLSRTLPPPPSTRRQPRDPYDTQLVCHAFVPITFAFSWYSRSAEARNCRSDRRDIGIQIGQIWKSENLLIFFPKTENQILKNGKSVNRNEYPNRETEVLWHKNRKTDLKNSQNRKTENPSAPLDKQETHTIKDISQISVHAQKSALLRKSAHP